MTKQELNKKIGKSVDRTFINENLLFFYISRKALDEMREKSKELVAETDKKFQDGSIVPNYDETIVNIRYSMVRYKSAFVNEFGNVVIEVNNHSYIFNFNELQNCWILNSYI